ncbi:MAG: DUF1501 domain-containing protein [Acidobacteria bacterium]|nr:DUF1501 domain-containing protein [Acidobacteriota bacterium]
MVGRSRDFCNQTEVGNLQLGELDRRSFLLRLGQGLGSVAFSWLLQQDAFSASNSPENQLAVRPPHFPVKAKSCIFLFMAGGPSQMDTFDPKPLLTKYHGTVAAKGSQPRANSNLLYVGSPFEFAKHGQCGMEVSEIFPHLATCVDDIAVVRSLQTDSDAHSTGAFLMNTAQPIPGSPSLGSWLTYGLGTENQNLPAFVVLPIRSVLYGAQNWSNGYLPAIYQGTPLNTEGTPIVDLQPPKGVTPEQQEVNIKLLNELNEPFLESSPIKNDLWARMKNYELAFRMQTTVPEALDVNREPGKIKELYGLNDKVTEPMGRRCLMARRLVERGVRFVQIYSSGWDSHYNLAVEHKRRGDETDRPIAGLLKDLKQRGLLDQTLVVWGGEFGRTPQALRNYFWSKIPGREHNRTAMLMWFAGGGVKGGTVVGATDELGEKAVQNVYQLHDLHATLLHLMGLNDMRLTYYHGGRFKRLTDLGGHPIKEMLT